MINKTNDFFIRMILSCLLLFSSCKKNSGNSGMIDDEFTDARDGKVYKVVKIGEQVWMAENLAYLPSVVGSSTGSFTMPYYYVYDYEGSIVADARSTKNFENYGVLYNWEAAKIACPQGWHLPSDSEWSKLIDYLGGDIVAGEKLKEADTLYWYFDARAINTNEVGFSALPGGYRYHFGSFVSIRSTGNWWSATQRPDGKIWFRTMSNGSAEVSRTAGGKDGEGLSVRCIKD
jgi:uncharacterized protein (TIGR02145 family)